LSDIGVRTLGVSFAINKWFRGSKNFNKFCSIGSTESEFKGIVWSGDGEQGIGFDLAILAAIGIELDECCGTGHINMVYPDIGILVHIHIDC